MLAGHLDTVDVLDWRKHWAGTDRESPFSGVLAENALWGRGAADLKGGIATAMEALRALHRAETRPYRDLITLWVCDEESGVPGLGRSVGMRATIERMESGEIPRPGFAVYLEPTCLAVYTAQITFVIAHVAINGQSAYFGRPDLGIDAFRVGHAVVDELWKLDAKMRAGDAHPLVGTRRLLVTRCQAGGLVAVPGSCEIELICTLLPSDDPGRAVAEIEAAVTRGAAEAETSVAVTFPAGRDHPAGGLGFEVGQVDEIEGLRAAVCAVSRGHSADAAAPYWSEGSLLSAIGVPCVYWPPGDISNCHTAQEHIDLAEFISGVKALALFLAGEAGPRTHRWRQ